MLAVTGTLASLSAESGAVTDGTSGIMHKNMIINVSPVPSRCEW